MAVTEVIDTVGGVLKKLVGDNEPQVTYTDLLANAVPKGVDADGLVSKGWSLVIIPFKGTWTMWPDSTAEIRIRFAHSARHKNGGAFITSVVGWVEAIDPAWRHKINITFKAGDPYLTYAYGEKTPVAVLPIRVEYLEKGVADNAQAFAQYYLYGNGHSEKA
jgi:hypothetical protein